MKRTLPALALAAAVMASTAACIPKPPPPPEKPQCGPYSVVWEARPMPCLPGRGDRVDFIMGVYPIGYIHPSSPVAVRNAAVARCNNVPLVGVPMWSDSTLINQRVLVCRTAGV